MYAAARHPAALGQVFFRLLAGAALILLAVAPALAADISAVPGTLEGRPSFRFFGSEQGLPQNTPQAFALDARGFLWTGTQDGAAVYNGRFWKTVDMPNREESNIIRDILAGADGSVWFATTIGLARLHNGQWTLFRKDAGLPSNRILSLAEERDGSRTVLWAGTDKGLAQWNGTAWTVLDTQTAGLPNERIRSLLALQTDQGPVLWVGTGHGLARRLGGRWKTFPAAPAGNGPPEAEVTALLATRDGGRSVLWVATDGGGLVRYDGDRWLPEKGLPSDRVLSLSLLDSGTGDELWAGTSRGLAHRAGGVWTVYNTENAGLPSDYIASLFASRSGGRPLLWIGMSTGGMAVLNPGGWRALDRRNSGLPWTWIYGLAESGPPGRPVYWFSTYDSGLTRWEAGTWKVFSQGTPLEHEEVNLVLPASGPHGTAFWVGTSRGLHRWEGGRWEGAGEIAAGLPASEVLSLLESRTPAGPVLWVGTRDGLARCAAGDVRSSPRRIPPCRIARSMPSWRPARPKVPSSGSAPATAGWCVGAPENRPFTTLEPRRCGTTGSTPSARRDPEASGFSGSAPTVESSVSLSPAASHSGSSSMKRAARPARPATSSIRFSRMRAAGSISVPTVGWLA